MRYVVLIFRTVDREWTDADADALRGLIALRDELAATGELVSAEGLQLPGQGRIVQIRDGSRVVTDGPFGEATEQLAGFFLIDVADDAQAQSVAAQVSAAVRDRVELRGTLISA